MIKNPPPPRLTREQSQAQTCERLLSAARHVFAQEGYAGASVDVIAAQAGYSKGAFYSNFPTKEAIFLELLRRHMAHDAEQLESLVQGERALDAVLAKLDEWLSALSLDLDWCLLATELQLQARRSPSVAAEYGALQAQQRDRLGGLVAQLFALAGRELPRPAGEIAGGLMALANGLVLQGGARSGDSDPTGPMMQLVIRSLLLAAPPQVTDGERIPGR